MLQSSKAVRNPRVLQCWNHPSAPEIQRLIELEEGSILILPKHQPLHGINFGNLSFSGVPQSWGTDHASKIAMINSASWDIREGFCKGGPAEDLPTLQIFEAILPAAQSSSRRLAHSPENGEKITMDVSKVEDDLSFSFQATHCPLFTRINGRWRGLQRWYHNCCSKSRNHRGAIRQAITGTPSTIVAHLDNAWLKKGAGFWETISHP